MLRKFLDVRRAAGNEHLIRSIFFDWTSYVWLHYGPQPVVQRYMNESWYLLCQRLSEMANLRKLVVAIKPVKKETVNGIFRDNEHSQLLMWLINLNATLQILEQSPTGYLASNMI